MKCIFLEGVENRIRRLRKSFKNVLTFWRAPVLSFLAIVNGLVIDAYGPISDNVGGIAKMDGFRHKIHERLDALNPIGNTTASFGKVRCSIVQLFFGE